jgi:hypothetical protein
MTNEEKAAIVKFLLAGNKLLRAKKDKTRKDYAGEMAEALSEYLEAKEKS